MKLFHVSKALYNGNGERHSAFGSEQCEVFHIVERRAHRQTTDCLVVLYKPFIEYFLKGKLVRAKDWCGRGVSTVAQRQNMMQEKCSLSYAERICLTRVITKT